MFSAPIPGPDGQYEYGISPQLFAVQGAGPPIIISQRIITDTIESKMNFTVHEFAPVQGGLRVSFDYHADAEHEGHTNCDIRWEDMRSWLNEAGFSAPTNVTPLVTYRVALVERGGNVRAKMVAGVSHKNLRQFVGEVVDQSATVNTDQWNGYRPLFRHFGKHETVQHSVGEFSRVNADGSVVHVNTCESFFSLLKRGMVGAFHHVSKEHLPRYLHEFEFRWDRRKMSDGERMKELILATRGKRLTYKTTVAKEAE